jgi:hypothetical protein
VSRQELGAENRRIGDSLKKRQSGSTDKAGKRDADMRK